MPSKRNRAPRQKVIRPDPLPEFAHYRPHEHRSEAHKQRMMGMILGNRFERKYSVRDFVSLFSWKKSSVQDLMDRIRREEEGGRIEIFTEQENVEEREQARSAEEKP